MVLNMEGANMALLYHLSLPSYTRMRPKLLMIETETTQARILPLGLWRERPGERQPTAPSNSPGR